MNGNYLLGILIVMISGCKVNHEQLRDNCYEVKYSNKNINTDKVSLTLNNSVVFDTTANLLNIKLVRHWDGSSIKDARISMIQNSDTITGVSNLNGEFEIFKNNFHGEWDIIISSPEFNCISIDDFEIAGGQWITIGFKK